MKALIENILEAKADMLQIDPSPSKDPWFDNLVNMKAVQRGIDDVKAGRVTAYSMDEIWKLLDV